MERQREVYEIMRLCGRLYDKSIALHFSYSGTTLSIHELRCGLLT